MGWKETETGSYAKDWREQYANLQKLYPQYVTSGLFSHPNQNANLEKTYFEKNNFYTEIRDESANYCFTFFVCEPEANFDDSVFHQIKAFFEDRKWSEIVSDRCLEQFVAYYQNLKDNLKRYNAITVAAKFVANKKVYFFGFLAGESAVSIKINDKTITTKSNQDAELIARIVNKSDQVCCIYGNSLNINLDLKIEEKIPEKTSLCCSIM